MVKSMTGFGRSIVNFEERKYIVEIKTINHRYNDISIRMPRYLNFLEDKLRSLISKNISRGKIDVFITIENLNPNNKLVKIDEALAGTYIEEMRKLSKLYNLDDDIKPASILRLPDVIVNNQEIDEEVYFNELKICTEEAIEVLNTARLREGENLKIDIEKRLEIINNNIDIVEPRSSSLVEEYRAKLNQRLEELGAKSIVDESRIATELVIFADKSSIQEEITRLRSHIKTFYLFLDSKEAVPVGKKIDFLIQEMNREVNTIGSKANCIDITNQVVLMKNEIENIREQIQNIE